MTSSGLLAGNVALVTGASRGIGASAAKLFALGGASVMLTARSEDQLREVTEKIVAAGGSADSVIAELSRRSEIGEVIEHTDSRFGRLTAPSTMQACCLAVYLKR